jgi:Fur family ferric uptake transcriptional regulator
MQISVIPTMIAATHSNHPLATVSTPVRAESALDEARARIRLAGLRITKPRLALIDALQRHPGPVSIERIHQEAGVGQCDLVTVYRCLAAFEQLGMVRRSYLHNGTCLYELTLGQAAHPYHIVCKACGATEPVDYAPVNGIEQVLQERGYTQVSHVVEFFGVCPRCQPAHARHAMPAIPAERC